MTKTPVIYLDNNSTTAVLPVVVEAMQPFWSVTYANPSSLHRSGQAARRAVDQARECMAACLDAAPDEIVFTSGATEANNLALQGLAATAPGVLLTSPLEHPSILEPLKMIAQRQGHAVRHLAVTVQGQLQPWTAMLSEELRLVTVQWANHEIKVVHNIAALAAQFPDVPFHCDATQAVGRIPVAFHAAGITSLSFSAHKFHGPKGIGALLLRRGSPLRPLLFGGGQQENRRPGTLPVALLVGMAKALELACREMAERTAAIEKLAHLFVDQLRQGPATPVIENGPNSGIPHTVNLAFPGCDAAVLLMKLDLAGVACSAGAACASGSLQPSPVLAALGLPPEIGRSSLRFSLSHLLTEAEIIEAARRIGAAVSHLRGGGADQTD